jgi:protein transport protein DSL1/ZW10
VGGTVRVRPTDKLRTVYQTILLRDDYFLAVGSLVNALLTRAVISVLSLSDITEVESRRLAELCRLLEQVQALFIKNGELDSLVGEFVPSWFRFQYLAELLVCKTHFT